MINLNNKKYNIKVQITNNNKLKCKKQRYKIVIKLLRKCKKMTHKVVLDKIHNLNLIARYFKIIII